MQKLLVPAPSDDKRWRMVTATMRRHGYRRDALIEALHSAQEAFGYLDSQSLQYVARSLNLPLSQVYGVATFYSFFTLKPPGEHTCVICLGTACYIKGAGEIIASIQDQFDLKSGQTTPDDRASLLTARCLGTCGLAPSGVFDGEVVGNLTPENVAERLGEWLDHAG